MNHGRDGGSHRYLVNLRMRFALKILDQPATSTLAIQGHNSRGPVTWCLFALWLRVVSFMKWRSKPLIKFQVASCAFALASLFSANAQSSPTPRTGHNAAWDAARGELVIFGGFDGPSPTDETWVWNGTWTLKNPATRPAARVYANMAYDEARQQ